MSSIPKFLNWILKLGCEYFKIALIELLQCYFVAFLVFMEKSVIESHAVSGLTTCVVLLSKNEHILTSKSYLWCYFTFFHCTIWYFAGLFLLHTEICIYLLTYLQETIDFKHFLQLFKTLNINSFLEFPNQEYSNFI
jgi:hypothetical protein